MPVVCTALVSLALLGTPPSSAGPPEDNAAFIGKRRALAANVGVAAGTVVVGALTLSIPLVTWNHWDGTPLLTPIAIGSVLMVSGGFATAALASVLGHHERWHRPGLRGDTDLAHRRRRGLAVGLGVSLGTIGLGAIAFGLGSGLSRSCDPEGNCAALTAGYTVGTTLLVGGSLSTVATGTLLGIHRSHRHDRASVSAGSGGIMIRF